MKMVDLHNHTFYSYDSSSTPREVVENAMANGIDVVGITDHQFSVREKLYDYIKDINSLKEEFSDRIQVLCGLEIGTRPMPDDFFASCSDKLDYCLFECLDSEKAVDFYEFMVWRNLFSCPVGFAHTDVFLLSERYGMDILSYMRDADIFWEINTSGNYPYYYDFLTNPKKRQALKESGVKVSIGSDTHNIADYDASKIKRAHNLVSKLGINIVFGN